MNITQRTFKSIFAAILFAAAVFVFSSSNALAQRRDFMTDAEIELVRENQDINLRIDVLVKMIDRRLSVLNIAAGGWKPPAKETDVWGEAPAGTRLELLTDVKRLLQKAVDDIDDVAEHDSNAQTQNKTTGKLFPIAVRSLATAASRYSAVLQPIADSAADQRERGAVLDSLDLCQQIIDAAVKLPAEQKKEKKN